MHNLVRIVCPLFCPEGAQLGSSILGMLPGEPGINGRNAGAIGRMATGAGGNTGFKVSTPVYFFPFLGEFLVVSHPGLGFLLGVISCEIPYILIGKEMQAVSEFISGLRK